MRLKKHLQDESGMALLIAVVLLLMITALGLTALENARSESSTSGRARRKDANLYAAEAGMNMLLDRMARPDQNNNINRQGFDNPGFIQDGFGYNVRVRTGTPGDYSLEDLTSFVVPGNVDASGKTWGFNSPIQFEYYRPNVVAEDIAGGIVHVQAQFVVVPPNSGTSSGGYKK